MLLWKNKKILIVAAVLVVALFSFTLIIPGSSRIDYSSQVKPLLNKKCIICHGGVKKQGGFSLLFRSDALANTKSGKPAIIPGDPDHSEMIRRLTLKDPEERMPYQHEPLSSEEIGMLRKWIKQGAAWGEHWSYVPVKPVEVPKPKSSFWGLIPARQDDWARNDIDYFILEKLAQEDLRPSPEADKPTLLRRVSLDLTGLLPSASLARQYLQSNTPGAYESLVDSLLASPHFGERWASVWMDLARYADTKGYEADRPRTIWRYRDWLIRAFNEDMPYDRFLTEQIAGDLLPNATDADYIATAFHRNTMTNDEGGTDDEEFRTSAVLDRVNTTWEALMGTTFACVQCHSHPYDPFRHDEYYQFLAYFNNTRDEDKFGDYPLLRTLNDTLQQQLNVLTKWVGANSSFQKAKEISRFIKTWQPAVYAPDAAQTVAVNRALEEAKGKKLSYYVVTELKNVDLQNKNQFIYRYLTYAKKGTWRVRIDEPDGPVIATLNPEPFTDWDHLAWKNQAVDFIPQQGIHNIYVVHENLDLKKREDNGIELDWFHFTEKFPGRGKPGYEWASNTFTKLVNADLPTTPVMMENPAGMSRETHVFERGNWMVKGRQVEPGIPQSLSSAMPARAPKDRLGLAMWLTSKQNPLVSRTMVNRLWEQLFGSGIVETLEDLGTQGIAPTHRELLDRLSWKFVNDFNWSIKKTLKEIVMSATYRQDSRISEELKQKDLFNKLYARGPRIRLSAEQVRDQALSASDLLNEKMYGPSVFPFQPHGLWLSPYNGEDWKQSDHGDQYRRALYTFWKRTAPYPSMISFDVNSREVCTARRIRTNTPLQALVTLNDSAYIDMARHFADYMYSQSTGNVQAQIAKGYENILFKPIPQDKLQILLELYREALEKFKKDADKTCEICGGVNAKGTPEKAALIMVANAMLNLDEVITKS